ncbi:hypothetical protein [Chryseobacterium indoltheticum]|uniref:Uncharacterized protein n=1 Tax=Chryseobacterium indoltheticum TaxID=254 RepID=A0A3G6N7D2_9FLAO|nr:hypothetical protein [Chryseobacterium indoltheticum]AZA60829.1 hypothetical protein EG340_07135 [Chryseobacterium indoltheticum]
MKTKVLFIGAICALSVYSCSPERDEQLNENPATAEKLDIEKLKINNLPGFQNKIESDTTNIGITPYSLPLNNGSGLDPETGTEPDPNEGGIVHPGDVKPPKP